MHTWGPPFLDVENLVIQEDHPEHQRLLEFRDTLCKQIRIRFANEGQGGEDVSTGRKIVVANVFEDKVYNMATILDPRLKTSVFVKFQRTLVKRV